MSFSAQIFSKKLRNLRESYGDSLGQVSSVTAIDERMLSDIEQGAISPTGDQILILADYFKCELAWLIEDQVSNPDENMTLLLRSGEGRLNTEDRHAVAEFLYLCKTQKMLEELLDQQRRSRNFTYSPKGNFFKKHGEDCARHLRQFFDLPPHAVIPDIFEWLRKAGLKVFRRSLQKSPISGLFIRHPYAGDCILINSSEDIYRQRFSAAHEAGHALMDQDKSYNISEGGDIVSSDFMELRANSFASHFLMPSELLQRMGDKEQWKNPDKVLDSAKKLSVSASALLVALRRDNILDQNTYEQFKGIRLQYSDKSDPELGGNLTALQIERKKRLLQAGLNFHYVEQAFEAHRRKLISIAKLADILLVDPAEIADLSILFGLSTNHG